MRNAILLFTLFISALGNSQITIQDSDFPSSGDTAMVSISSTLDLDYEATGADYTWDFSELVMEEQRIDTFNNIDDASFTYQIIFNNGFFDEDYQADYYQKLLNFAIPSTEGIGVAISNPVGFTKVESDKVEAVGVGLEISGIEVPVKNEIIDIVYELPLAYEDNAISNSFFEIDLNPAFDGILRRYQERTTVVDGWGTISTPYGEFDVVRVKATLNFTDSLRIAIGGGDPFWIELPTPTQTFYSWITKEQKIPVLEVVVQETFGESTVSSVEYKDAYRGFASTPTNFNNSFDFYPNPAQTEIYLSGLTAGTNLQILTVTGQLVINHNFQTENGVLDVSALPSGHYFIKVISGSAIRTEQLIIH